MWNIILIEILIIVLLLFMRPRMSWADESPPPNNCSPKMVSVGANCANLWPGKWGNDGPVTGDKKYCCE